MSETGWIVHRIAGRIRVRLPQRRKDTAFFAGLVAQLAEMPGVEATRANPLTGSLLIEFNDEAAAVARLDMLLEEQGIALQTGEPPLTPARPAMREGVERLDQWVGMASQQATDLRSIGVLFFFALSIVQLARGQVLAPATSLLWYALDLLRDPLEPPSAD